jgi:hypothetical protein
LKKTPEIIYQEKNGGKQFGEKKAARTRKDIVPQTGMPFMLAEDRQQRKTDQGADGYPPVNAVKDQFGAGRSPLAHGFYDLEDVKIEKNGHYDDDAYKPPIAHNPYFMEQNCGKLP